MDRLKRRIRHIKIQKKAKELWSEHGKNYTKNELIILAKASGIQYYYSIHTKSTNLYLN